MRRFVVLALVVASAVAEGSPLTPQSVPLQTPTTGFVDPTASTANGSHPMVSCLSSCATALVNQNTDALQWAIGQACASPHPWIYLPPGQYPIARGGASHNQLWGVQAIGCTNLVVRGYDATLRATGDLGAGDYWMFEVAGGSSHVRFYGVTFSQRDLTHSPIPEQTHMIEVGNQDANDDIQVVDCAFVDGKGGDAFRMLGGFTASTAITRVVVARNLIDGKRAGVSYQHDTSMVDVVGNWFGPNGTDQFIDHEPTSDPGNSNENTIGNVLYRPTPSGAAILSTSGHTEIDGTNDYNVYAYNICPNGSWGGINITKNWFVGNLISSDDTQNNPVINQFRVADTIWIVGNWLRQRESNAIASTAISFLWNAGLAPQNVWIRDNRIQQYTAINGGAIALQPVRELWVTDNQITYHNAAGDSGANGFIGIVVTSENTLYGNSTPARASGWITNNRIRRDVQSDGITQAGRPLAAVDFGTGTAQSFGHSHIRDNFVDSAKETFIINEAGSPIAEAPPLLSGNVGVSVTTDNLPAKYVVELVGAAETVATSAALSPSRPLTRVAGDCGADVDTLADGARDGLVKVVDVFSACASTASLTPAHFGDGTSISWDTTSIRVANFALAWDAAAGTWRLLWKTANVTVVP